MTYQAERKVEDVSRVNVLDIIDSTIDELEMLCEFSGAENVDLKNVAYGMQSVLRRNVKDLRDVYNQMNEDRYPSCVITREKKSPFITEPKQDTVIEDERIEKLLLRNIRETRSSYAILCHPGGYFDPLSSEENAPYRYLLGLFEDIGRKFDDIYKEIERYAKLRQEWHRSDYDDE